MNKFQFFNFRRNKKFSNFRNFLAHRPNFDQPLDRPGIEGPHIFIVPSVHDNRISNNFSVQDRRKKFFQKIFGKMPHQEKIWKPRTVAPLVRGSFRSGPKIQPCNQNAISCDLIKMIQWCRMSDFYDESYQIRASHWSMWITRSRLVIN